MIPAAYQPGTLAQDARDSFNWPRSPCAFSSHLRRRPRTLAAPARPVPPCRGLRRRDSAAPPHQGPVQGAHRLRLGARSLLGPSPSSTSTPVAPSSANAGPRCAAVPHPQPRCASSPPDSGHGEDSLHLISLLREILEPVGHPVDPARSAPARLAACAAAPMSRAPNPLI